MPALKPSTQKSPASRPAAAPAKPATDPLLDLFGNAVAAAQRQHFREAAGNPAAGEAEEDPYLQAVVAKNRGNFAEALALCRRGGRHRRDERMAYLAASILALEGELPEAAELLAFAVGQNARNRVQAIHDSDFAEVLGRAEFAFVLDPS